MLFGPSLDTDSEEAHRLYKDVADLYDDLPMNRPQKSSNENACFSSLRLATPKSDPLVVPLNFTCFMALLRYLRRVREYGCFIRVGSTDRLVNPQFTIL